MGKTFRFDEDNVNYLSKKSKKSKNLPTSRIFYSKINGKRNFGLSPLKKKRRTTYK